MLQVLVNTDFDYWYHLQKDRAGYEAEKERTAAEVLDRLQAHLAGVSSQVEMMDVATPYTFWRYTRNDRGVVEGWLMMPGAMRIPVEKILPGLEAFYMAGQWVEPGGGIPALLPSGRSLVQILCQRDGKPFSVSTP